MEERQPQSWYRSQPFLGPLRVRNLRKLLNLVDLTQGRSAEMVTRKNVLTGEHKGLAQDEVRLPSLCACRSNLL